MDLPGKRLFHCNVEPMAGRTHARTDRSLEGIRILRDPYYNDYKCEVTQLYQ